MNVERKWCWPNFSYRLFCREWVAVGCGHAQSFINPQKLTPPNARITKMRAALFWWWFAASVGLLLIDDNLLPSEPPGRSRFATNQMSMRELTRDLSPLTAALLNIPRSLNTFHSGIFQSQRYFSFSSSFHFRFTISLLGLEFWLGWLVGLRSLSIICKFSPFQLLFNLHFL